MKDYTLIIPTFNRPAKLEALLRHLCPRADFPILVLDSSSDENKQKNADAIAEFNLTISHIRFPQTMPAWEKWAKGFGICRTYYASLCADDDIVYVDGLRSCIAEMDKDESLSMCDGIYYHFDPERPRASLRLEYNGCSADDESPYIRLAQCLNRYEARVYAMFRTNTARKVFAFAERTMQSEMFWELFVSIAPLTIGKHKRLRIPYMARSAGAPADDARKRTHPWIWAKHDPDDLARHFEGYARHLAEFGRLDLLRVARAHMQYFENERVEMKFYAGVAKMSLCERPYIDELRNRFEALKKRLFIRGRSQSLKSILAYCQ